MNAKTESAKTESKAPEIVPSGMNRYRVVGGVATFGPGQEMELSQAQIEPRMRMLEPVRQTAGGGIVRALVGLQFKVGEELGLPDLPKHLTDIVVPIGEPRSVADKASLERAEQREAAAQREAERARVEKGRNDGKKAKRR